MSWPLALGMQHILRVSPVVVRSAMEAGGSTVSYGDGHGITLLLQGSDIAGGGRGGHQGGSTLVLTSNFIPN